MIHDLDRPDVKGVPPKMAAIATAAKEALEGLIPFLKVVTDDNLCSSVIISGSFDPQETWKGGIFHNSRYFILNIAPKGRYYSPDDQVSVLSVSGRIKIRKYTSTPEKVIAYVVKWINSQ